MSSQKQPILPLAFLHLVDTQDNQEKQKMGMSGPSQPTGGGTPPEGDDE